MAFDSGVVSALCSEIKNELLNCRVEKIYQPRRDEIDIYMRSRGKTTALVLSAMSGSPRFYISDDQKENPMQPPQFCVMLRKYLTGALLINVEQPEFERMAVFTFNCRDEMGFLSEKKLICEAMGKYANIIMCESGGKILGLYKTIDLTQSQMRNLLPGMIYEMPPKQEKENPLTLTKERFKELCALSEGMAQDRFIMANFSGISPLIAREVSYLSSGKTDLPLTPESADGLCDCFFAVIEKIKNCVFAPCLISLDGKTVEFSFTDIKQYGSAEVIKYESISKLVEKAYESKEHEGLVTQKAHDVLKILTNAEHRIGKKLALQKKELLDCADMEKYKKYGELVTANIYLLKGGEDSVRVVDYYSDDMSEIEIKLDKRITPAQNAQRFFKKYTKMKTAEAVLKEQIDMGERDMQYVYSVLDALTRVTTPSELEEIREELMQSGITARRKNSADNRKKQKPKLLEYMTSGGYRVFCGANNLQNDYLTFTLSGKKDYWFHVKNAPGSHAVMFSEGEEPPAEDFTQAAVIAAVNSSLGGNNTPVTVDYTLIKNIKKPPASKPGYVTYSTNYSAYVKPDKELCEKLRVGKKK